MSRFANIIIDISSDKLDRPFTYIVPDELSEKISVGSAVYIPFGAGNRVIRGYVIELTDRTELSLDKLKPISSIDEKKMDIESQFLSLAWRMKNRYGSTMSQAIKTVMPVKSKVKHITRTFIKAAVSREALLEELCIDRMKGYKAKERLVEALLENKILDGFIVREKLNISSSTIESLKKQGIIEVYSEMQFRNPVREIYQRYKDVELNVQQKEVIDEIWQDYNSASSHPWLLHGITGSGKTEVYLELIERVLALNKKVIVLIPEISLTYQTVMRFYRKFGNRVSIVNSKMSMGERYDQFLRAKNGEVDIMIGPRSALFTPFDELGLIVIDEEHEDSYKSEGAPAYDAREVALWRCQMSGGLLLLGSATPSLESRYMAEKGVYRLARLTQRGDTNSYLPKVQVVDLRKELKDGNRSILSRSLKEKIEERLRKKEQVMLFINRRGYSNFVSCRSCGETIMCPNCDISLTLHDDGTLRCHYCGFIKKADRKCPSCGSPYLAGFGMGTQKAAAFVQAEFPESRILRMDMDTTSKKGGHEEILEAFANQRADILIGTQMIVKGHDFKNVTLVGILVADKSLYSSNYRASEKTFQLLTQAAGRAGRGEKPGEVIIQTYRPEHFAVRAAALQDYDSFYEKEISYRMRMGYPPVRKMLSVLFISEDQYILDKAACQAAAFIKEYDKAGEVSVNGPVSDSIGRINNQYRRVIHVYSNKIELLISIQNEIQKIISLDKYKSVVINLSLC